VLAVECTAGEKVANMEIKRLTCGIILLGTVASLSAQAPAAPQSGKQPVTLTGCVAAGTRDDTYLLTRVERMDAATAPAGTATDAKVCYWLDPASKLASHVGHMVEVTGMLEIDVDTTTVKRKAGCVEVANEHAKKVEVKEDTPAAAAALAGGPMRRTYNVKVKEVKMLAPKCE
jgi:hypothetical protein